MNRFSSFFVVALSTLFIAACGGDAAGAGGAGGAGGSAQTPDYSARGPSAVGTTTTSLTDVSRDRTLPIEVWYPVEQGGDVSGVLEFETDPDNESALASLLESAPPECVATTTGATRDASAIAGAYPIILYSHCYACSRWSAHAVMEHLASHGFVVVAPDHTGDTLFVDPAELPPLDSDLLALRVEDIRFVLDRVLAGDVLPAGATPDASRLGMLGHSIGSITAGGVAQDDDRIAAVAGLAAPMENPLVQGVLMENIDVPLGFLVAVEDNSVGEAGNIILRNNFEVANTPAYKIEIADAGHWSVSNIAGIADPFLPGCGDGLRHITEEPFTYISVERGNALTATFVTAFFAAHLDGDKTALSLLRSNPWPDEAPLVVRE